MYIVNPREIRGRVKSNPKRKQLRNDEFAKNLLWQFYIIPIHRPIKHSGCEAKSDD